MLHNLFFGSFGKNYPFAQMNWFQAKRYFIYLLTARHWKGFGIHSPFVFDLVANLMREPYPYYDFQKITAWRQALIRSKEKVTMTDLGAGSVVTKTKIRRVSEVVRYGSISRKYGELLFRLVRRFNPDTILELGTSAGISSLYLALPNRIAGFITMEGCPDMATIAANTFERFHLTKVSLVNGPFNEALPKVLERLTQVDFVFFDGDHREEPTLNYFNLCLEKAHNETIFVFDDIHWSPGMERAWTTMVAHPRVTVSIDLFRLGILFFRRECQKEHFVVRF